MQVKKKLKATGPSTIILSGNVLASEFEVVCSQIKHDIKAALLYRQKFSSYERGQYYAELERKRQRENDCKSASKAVMDSRTVSRPPMRESMCGLAALLCVGVG